MEAKMNKYACRLWLAALCPALLLVFVTACGSDGEDDAGEPAVVTTFYPLQYLAERIGGERVSVKNLVPPGVEPHDWEPRPRDVTAIRRAKVFIYQGAGLEAWAERVLEGLITGGPVVVRATDGLPLTRGEGSDEPFDPHVWLDPVLYAKQAMAVRDALAKADPAGAGLYTANLAALTADLDRLTEEMKQGLARCQRATIVTSHSAFGYLAESFGLKQVAVSGLSPESEPSPARLRDVVEQVRREGATHIFFETLVSDAVAKTIAREADVQALALNPIEGLSSDELKAGESYLTVQRQNLANLRTALGCA
jgi:zinc transport system substrate-binding protein